MGQAVRSTLPSVFVLSLILVIPNLALAANHYVRAGAAGSGSGADWTNAYTDLPASMVRGDTYYVAAGTYKGHTFKDPVNGSTLITVKAATIADHGIATGWLDSYVGEARFNTASGGSIWNFTSDYYVVDGVYRGSDWRSGYGFHLDNSGAVVGNSTGIIAFNANNITIRYTNIEGSHSHGTPTDRGWTSYGNNNLLIEYNFAHDFGEAGCVMRGDTTSSNVTIQYNYFADNYSVGGSGIHSEPISIAEGIHNFTIRYNRFVNSVGTGAIADASSLSPNDNNNGPLYIYGNQMWYNSGLWPSGFSSYCAVGGFYSFINVGFSSDIYVYNNTIGNINNTVCPQGSGGDAQIWNQGDPDAKMKSGAIIHVKNNLWWNSNGGVNLAVSPTDVSNNDASVPNGAFASPTTFDFHLSGHRAGTSLSNAGTYWNGSALVANTFDIDADGNPRNAWDLGAYEFGTSVGTVAPPSGLTATVQ